MAKSSASRRLVVSGHTPMDAPEDDDKVVEVSFRPATGGMISETRMGNGMKSRTTIHPSIAHAVKHLKKSFGDAPDKPDGDGKEGSKFEED